MSNTSFWYEPLTKSGVIRLVVLKPSLSALQPISCSLKQSSLEDCDEEKARSNYEALSYTWGAKEGSVPITCDGQILLVTPNCESALRHLRQRFTERVLWIDAICINQRSVEEKNQQVPLMGEIYRAATRVIIWLGAGVDGDETMLSKARIGGRLYHARDLPGRTVLSHRHKQWASKFISAEDIDRVRRICSHEWFRRMWTMQELLLAETAVFQIGKTECPTSALYTYLLVAEALVDSESPERDLFRMRIRALELINPESVKKAGWLMSNVTSTEGGEIVRFLHLVVRMAAIAEASDVRDKVYGMVGLLKAVFDEFLLPEVDYDKDVAEIFESFTRGCIMTAGTLWPLEIMAGSYRKSSGLPSWVPDMRNPTAVRIDWQPKLSRSSRGEYDTEILESDEPGYLPVKARYLATVDKIFTRMPICEKESPDGELLRTACLSEWTATAASLEEEYANDMSCPSNYLSALDHLTPNLNRIRDKHEPPPVAVADEQEGKQASGWFSRRRSSDSDSDPGIFNLSPTHSHDTYDGAALFRTYCGLLGLCKGRIRNGDMVCQLAGGRFPFVLHQVTRPKHTEYTEYRLVGIADVFGLDAEHRTIGWSKDIREEEFYPILIV